METLVGTAEGLFADTFRAEARIEQERAEHLALLRRRWERYLAYGQIASEHHSILLRWFEAEGSLSRAAERLAEAAECTCDSSEVAFCERCDNEAKATRLKKRADRWLAAASQTNIHSGIDTRGSLAGPPVESVLPQEAYVMEWVAGEQCRVMLDPDEYIRVGDEDMLMPAFRPIAYDELKPRTQRALDRLVSYAPNWAREVEEWYLPDLYSKPHASERAETIAQRAKIRLKKRWVYPGRHLIGREDQGFRIAVLTVYIAARRQWAVYSCLDGGRDRRNFTMWQPFEWTLIEQHPIRDRGLADSPDDQPCWDVALAVAAKRAKQLRAEWGQVDEIPGSPLPFSPDRLKTMAESIELELEYSRKHRRPDPGPAQ